MRPLGGLLGVLTAIHGGVFQVRRELPRVVGEVVCLRPVARGPPLLSDLRHLANRTAVGLGGAPVVVDALSGRVHGLRELDERCDEARALGAQVLRLAGGLHARLRCLSRCEGRGRESVDLLPPRFELTNAPITEADEPHYTLSMPESWNEGVRGTQVPLLINLDADTIRCVAGPGSGKTAANIHVVTWKTPEAEAAGMAAAIVNNIHAHPSDRHLAMVTRRQFGYWLRDKIAELDSKLGVELGFSEGLL